MEFIQLAIYSLINLLSIFIMKKIWLKIIRQYYITKGKIEMEILFILILMKK